MFKKCFSHRNMPAELFFFLYWNSFEEMVNFFTVKSVFPYKMGHTKLN